jgi:uncharacterized membrane protein YccF (DUF307 family)
MKLLGNIIWVVFGGFFVFLEYLIGGFVLCLTIIGIPFGLQCFKCAMVGLFPFGTQVSNNPQSSGCLNLIMNIIWLLFGGIWIMLTHLLFGLLLCITIIGIPFGMQHFKLMRLALSPFGKTVS